MVKLPKTKSTYTLSGKNRPIASIESGKKITFETNDCYNNQIKDESTLYHMVNIQKNNPATGPLFIKGAEKGDILKVFIDDIKVDSSGVMTARPGVGVLGEYIKESRSKIIPIKNSRAIFNEQIKIPINPMIGVIGTAPEKKGVKTMVPGVHGGNLDCRKITKRSTVYLPVFHPGGLLSMGDLHAVMADGEVVICGLEIGGEVSVKIHVLKHIALPLPMVADDKYLYFLFSARTLDEAAKKVTKLAHDFLMDQLGLGLHEAGQLLSLVGNLGICQMVNALKTVRMEIPLYVFDKYGFDIP